MIYLESKTHYSSKVFKHLIKCLGVKIIVKKDKRFNVAPSQDYLDHEILK